MRELRSVTDLPIGVGFGISTPAQAREVASFADAVVVGSAISQLIETHAQSAIAWSNRSAHSLARLKDAMRAARQGGTSATA